MLSKSIFLKWTIRLFSRVTVTIIIIVTCNFTLGCARNAFPRCQGRITNDLLYLRDSQNTGARARAANIYFLYFYTRTLYIYVFGHPYVINKISFLVWKTIVLLTSIIMQSTSFSFDNNWRMYIYSSAHYTIVKHKSFAAVLYFKFCKKSVCDFLYN